MRNYQKKKIDFIYLSNKEEKGASSPQAVKYFKKIVQTKDSLKAMLEQSARTNNKFPLKGIEHLFIKKKGESYCKYCGYNKDNLFHPSH
jgi:hypothetical protein